MGEGGRREKDDQNASMRSMPSHLSFPLPPYFSYSVHLSIHPHPFHFLLNKKFSDCAAEQHMEEAVESQKSNFKGTSRLPVARSNSGGSNRHLANMGNYNSEEGKIRASLKWLVSRIYADNYVPDGLRELFFNNAEGHLQLTAPVIACLANGSFYCQAATRIFHDNAMVSSQNNIGTVFSALSQVGIDVRDSEGNSVVEEALLQSNPLNINVHLHMIDALMTAHLRSLVSIEKVVQAISNYTAVEKREEPLDCVDALLFWINKICLLVRDDIERNGLPGASELLPIIPEMEDLYEDLCDGTCVCALLSFYRPNEVPLQEICFNDPMSVNDCRFNLEILSKFCATNLPWNPFHFGIEDILYLHESLQPNVNVLLADLFQFFEGQELTAPHPEMISAPISTQRRFVPIQPIPDLRSQDISKMMPFGIKNVNQRLGITNKRDRASSMASEDSLATLQTKDSLSASTPRATNLDPNAPNVTHFAAFQSAATSNDQQGKTTSISEQQRQNLTQQPPQQQKSMAEIRLQMEEMRRQLAQRQQMEMAQLEKRRNEASKDAFFRVMSKSATNELKAHPASHHQQQTEALTRSQENDLATQFQQMNMGTQMKMGPNSAVGHYDQPFQQLTQQYLAAPTLQPQQPIATLTSTPHGNVSFPSSHPMLSPIGPPQQIPLNGSFDPSLGAGVQPYNVPFASPNSGSQQGQQLFRHSEQSHYAVPNGVHPMQQQYADTSYSAYGHTTGPPAQFPQPNSGMGYGSSISLQPSSSQTSHLHIMHQHPSHSHLQHPQQHYQQPQQHIQHPYYQTQQPHYAPPNQTTFPSQYVPSPLPPPINTATMFPSAETLVFPPQQTQLFMDNQFLGAQMEQPSSSLVGGAGTFRLHQPNAPPSKLDPQLDLNKDMASWQGQMTYRAGDRPQRKTWAQKQSETGQSSNNLSSSSGGATTDGGRTIARLSGDSGDAVSTMYYSMDKEPPSQLDNAFRNEESSYLVTANGSSSNRSGGLLVADVTEPNSEMTPEMQAKRQAILANQIRRKERIVAKSEEKELEEMDRLQVKMQRIEQAELRKLEREQRRQKLLEDYKRKKMEQELEPSSSARTCTSSTISLNRGHSQPPFGRPKSQSNMNLSNAAGGTLKRLGRAQSNVGDEENATPRISVPSIAEPTQKLFAKNKPKSNRGLIMNALQYSVFPGHVSNEQRQKAQAAIAQSDSKHFLALFRDDRCQYRGLYTWDQFSDTVHKIDGLGPRVCKESMMTIMFKYDSGAKSFGKITTKHLSATIDGFVIADQYWQKPKIPHSGR